MVHLADHLHIVTHDLADQRSDCVMFASNGRMVYEMDTDGRRLSLIAEPCKHQQYLCAAADF